MTNCFIVMNAKSTLLLHNKFLLLLVSLYIGSKDIKATETGFMALDKLPEWIVQNIYFPQDAYEYGFAGKEKFVISLDWSGRAFITSPLNTLHPAFSKEIREVVKRAPKCYATGILTEDIYKSVEIDFYMLVPQEKRKEITNVGEYKFAIFPYHTISILGNSREDFIDWLTERYDVPKGLNNYTDTLTVIYKISKNGRIKEGVIEGGRYKPLVKELTATLKKAPPWKPAQTRAGEKLDVWIYDSFIIGIDANGRKLPPALLKDEVCKNSSKTPNDSDIVILNPEIKASFNGQQEFLSQMLRDSIRVSKPVKYSASIVINTDGRVEKLFSEADDDRINKQLKHLISLSQWLPAIQGGVPVRSICSFKGILSPKNGTKRRAQTRLTRYGSFMMSGRQPSFYDPGYEADQLRRWRKLIKAYPAINSDIYGYSIFRRMDRLTYIEYLMIHGDKL